MTCNKVAVITGSTSGLGLAMARQLAKQGISIIVTGLADDKVIEEVLQEIRGLGSKADFVPCDLRSAEHIETFAEKVFDIYPEGIHILINNAGVQCVRDITEFPDEKWHEMIGVMLTAPYLLTKKFVPAMKKKGWGRIINTSSQLGVVSAAGKTAYSTMKSGIIGFTKGAALDLASYGVTCNAICPTFASTAIMMKQVEEKAVQQNISLEEAEAQFVSAVPMKRFVTPEQVAELASFLICSDAANMITGSVYLIDGGYTAQ